MRLTIDDDSLHHIPETSPFFARFKHGRQIVDGSSDSGSSGYHSPRDFQSDLDGSLVNPFSATKIAQALFPSPNRSERLHQLDELPRKRSDSMHIPINLSEFNIRISYSEAQETLTVNLGDRSNIPAESDVHAGKVIARGLEGFFAKFPDASPKHLVMNIVTPEDTQEALNFPIFYTICPPGKFINYESITYNFHNNPQLLMSLLGTSGQGFIMFPEKFNNPMKFVINFPKGSFKTIKEAFSRTDTLIKMYFPKKYHRLGFTLKERLYAKLQAYNKAEPKQLQMDPNLNIKKAPKLKSLPEVPKKIISNHIKSLLNKEVVLGWTDHTNYLTLIGNGKKYLLALELGSAYLEVLLTAAFRKNLELQNRGQSFYERLITMTHHLHTDHDAASLSIMQFSTENHLPHSHLISSTCLSQFIAKMTSFSTHFEKYLKHVKLHILKPIPFMGLSNGEEKQAEVKTVDIYNMDQDKIYKQKIGDKKIPKNGIFFIDQHKDIQHYIKTVTQISYENYGKRIVINWGDHNQGFNPNSHELRLNTISAIKSSIQHMFDTIYSVLGEEKNDRVISFAFDKSVAHFGVLKEDIDDVFTEIFKEINMYGWSVDTTGIHCKDCHGSETGGSLEALGRMSSQASLARASSDPTPGGGLNPGIKFPRLSQAVLSRQQDEVLSSSNAVSQRVTSLPRFLPADSLND